MLTFFAITTIVNLALGYGLAIYLGHDRKNLPGIVLPGQSPVDGAADGYAIPPSVIPAATPPLASLTPAPSLPGVSAAQLPELVSPLQRSGPVGSPMEAEKSQAEIPSVAGPLVNQTSVVPEQSHPRVETPENSPGAPTETSDSTPATNETLDVTETDNPADDHQHQAPDACQASVDNPTAATTAETNPGSQPPSEEDLLAGIAAFRAQLSEVNTSTGSVESQDANINAPRATVPG